VTTVERPRCMNHADRDAVGLIETDTGRERHVCESCADRFWALADAPTCSATLRYLRMMPTDAAPLAPAPWLGFPIT
jgi:hypothetical protein